MTLATALQVTWQPWLTIMTSWLGSGVLSALVAGIYSLRAKRNEHVNDYYKAVIRRRIVAYEQLENLIIQLKTSVVDKDGRPYHLPFSSEKEEDWDRAIMLPHPVMSRGLWLSDEAFDKVRDLNYLLFHSDKPASVVEFGKKNYQTIATLRTELERSLAKDMLSLHEVKRFLKSKDRPDPGFHLVKLKTGTK